MHVHSGWAGLFAVFTFACGGSVVSSADNASSSGGSSSGSSGPGASSGFSGSSGEASSSGSTNCSTAPIDGNRACVPSLAPPNEPITLEVDDTAGCLACFTGVDPCKVSVIGNRINLQLTATSCPPKGDVACPAVCGIPSAKCVVPALPPGKYIVEVSGENRVGYPQRELVVGANTTGSASSCELTPPGQPPEPIDGKKYSKSCSKDDDCSLVSFGNPCQPCICPNGAIAKDATDSYYAAYRAAVSQCPSNKESIVCGACAPAKAKCEIAGTAAKGTCKLVAP